ncbi:MAG: N-methyl-L-tryptophan oxidase [Gemmataceae bacterium]|nr:N-methyl-L-tryptophan oxidase [Gemmataceae bacterium]
MESFDAVVIGLGAMGSSASMFLSRRGLKVLGLEQFTQGHELGSSHGSSRAIRLAYYEHPSYVGLLQRAYPLWRELESRTGEMLLDQCGCLTLGPPTHPVLEGIRESARRHGLEIENLKAEEIQRRFPFLYPGEGYEAVYETAGGYLRAGKAVRCFQDQALEAGADFRFQCPALSWKRSGSLVEVETAQGKIHTPRLVITAGPWARRLLGPPGQTLTVMRQTLHWFTPEFPERFHPSRAPVFMSAEGEDFFYGFPSVDPEGVKVARHYGAEELLSPDGVDRENRQADVQPVRNFFRARIPSLADRPCTKSNICLYTLSPDRHFLLGAMPGEEGVFLAAGFSGHGFKFASVVGEILHHLVLGNSTGHDLDFLHPGRFLHDKPAGRP